ncbi:hypothetical protein F5148DRAFT_1151546 [Russula earlei]|uniref:Uncharacterized protein n=1 Tax=Russula earlei TaxID=71964 RepID=A0ACC0U152_9AGAM|nr:hypothetical protein F5148DRAFT_1151546 [Russula earlei]
MSAPCLLTHSKSFHSNNLTQTQPLKKGLCNPTLYKVMWIILLTLCIMHYSHGPPQWPRQPKIHVTGDWDTTATLQDLAPMCRMVEMVLSGDICWTLTGVEHELLDPLGPFWVWKVGPLNDDAMVAMGDRRAPYAHDSYQGAGKVIPVS